MIDNFSFRSDEYAKYRPTYPLNFFEYLNSIVPNKQNAWDCGTGNGQIAYELSRTFKNVFASDISQSQIDHALHVDNITYSVQPAERTNFDNQFFDLIIIAQAIHWFSFEKFYILWAFIFKLFHGKDRVVIIFSLLILSVIAIYTVPYIDVRIYGENYDLGEVFFVSRWIIPAMAPILLGALFAIISYELFEKKVLRLKNKYKSIAIKPWHSAQ